ncbi:unnamed protein product [Caenorhabditis nigoni]
MQKLLIFAFIVAVVAGQCSLKCPDGYLSFKRTPTPQNSMTSLWCVKTIFPESTINVTTAKALCAQEKAVLTTFENDDERLQLSSALSAGLAAKKMSLGQMFVDGHRLPQCQTQDRTILRASPCFDPTTGFTTDDKHTDNTFMFQNWADTEPSASFWQTDVESCIALGISQFEKRNKKLNDIQCDYDKSPANAKALDMWNVGVACGRLPEFQ